MSRRITKTLSMELIGFVKKLQVNANFWDKNSKSAFEFARQMSSPNLAKKNPQYECIMIKEPDVKYIPKMRAEFLDGSVLEMDTNQHTCAGLRALFFEKAEEAEEAIAVKGGGGAGTADKADAAKGKGGAKGGGGGGGKPAAAPAAAKGGDKKK
jgi:hypothetical protein